MSTLELQQSIYEKTGFTQCPLLERCRKVSGMKCEGRDFSKCDFLWCVFKITYPAHKYVPEKYQKLYGVFWPKHKEDIAPFKKGYLRDPKSQSEINRKQKISNANKRSWLFRKKP